MQTRGFEPRAGAGGARRAWALRRFVARAGRSISTLRTARFVCGAARALAVAGLLLALVLPAEPATLASWNIRHLGHGEHKAYPALGEVVRLGAFDFLAVQEAMTEDGIDGLRAAIEAATGTHWSAMASHSLGRSSYKEKYAFLWNNAVVEYVDGAVVYLDITDRFAREPYSARFRIRESGLTFVAATAHILYGRGVAEREPEIEALAAYWRWLAEVYPDDAGRIVMMGDFNLSPKHSAWAALRAGATPLIVAGATTLSTVDGRFANLYDNIWVPAVHNLPVASFGIFEFPAALGLTHEQARRHVSDHAPVWVRLSERARPDPLPLKSTMIERAVLIER